MARFRPRAGLPIAIPSCLECGSLCLVCIEDGDPHLELRHNSSGRHSRPFYVSRPLRRISRPKSASVPLALAGGAALVVAGIGGFAAPAAGVNPLVTMSAWPVSLTELSSDPQVLVGLAAARAVEDRASRDGARTALNPKPVKPGERKRARVRTPADLIESRWARPSTPSVDRVVLPTDNFRLTARFGSSGSLWAGDHTGLDFAAPAGTAVRAVAGGRVVETGWAGACGWRIRVQHRDNTETWYCHLSEILVTDGRVWGGEKIGRIGSTGNSTGPHLHFEVHPDGTSAVDPETWLKSHGINPKRLAFPHEP